MDRPRPDPETLLTAAKEEEQSESRGALKIFFGAAPGVGKTYTMLEEAQRLRAEGVDVVVGVVETHGRSETDRLIEGLEVLPRRKTQYRTISLPEFDLEAALKRRPALILVDELAHTNAPDTWHAKRWQDVQELLDAGIDVHTTLNVQHLESVNDLVARVTGVIVRETVPDAIFDHAKDVELVDLTSDDLLQRLQEGKVYIPAQASRAMDAFFTKGNLIALRELALRRMADRVEAQKASYRQSQGAGRTAPLADRFIVAVSPSPFAQRVVRAAYRLAERLQAEWEVVYVEPATATKLAQDDRDRVFQTLRLAEQLGARTTTLTGERPAAELLRYAVERSVSRVIVGRPGRPKLRDRIRGTFVDDLIQNDAGIDVHVVRGKAEEVARHQVPASARPTRWWPGYFGALAVMAACTLIGVPVARHFHETSTAMMYVLGTVLIALIWGRGPSVMASVIGVLCYDFFFIPPFYTFSVDDVRYLFTFLVILVVGNVIATLALQIKRQADIARQHERRTQAMYQLTRDLSTAGTPKNLAETTGRTVAAATGRMATVFLPDGDGKPQEVGDHPDGTTPLWPKEVVRWVFDHGRVAGFGTDTFPTTEGLFLPLVGTHGPVGVLALRVFDASLAREPEQMLLLDALARQAGRALDQLRLVEEANEARMQAEAERLQSSLLASVSHDLRTPLATITGAASSLLESGDALACDKRLELASVIHHEADRLGRLVTNLLQMTRLESGALHPNRDWQSVEELVGAALGRMETALRDHPVSVAIPSDLPLIRVDALLMEQVLLNLLDNTVKHTPPGSAIEIAASKRGHEVVLTVADIGPGLPPGTEDKVFEKFFRGRVSGSDLGAGLGLAIVEGFVAANGGRVSAANRPDGGAVFEVRLPLNSVPIINMEAGLPDDDPSQEGVK